MSIVVAFSFNAPSAVMVISLLFNEILAEPSIFFVCNKRFQVVP
jgi:hypothetical protein